ncbi:hypothetical protein N7456_011056 [Penicillium angulare]|uniref:Uncharacterized protein n=1 Tax=Penicillium angulare TaxID=116970 RepID=A0A9W9ETB1_9EURO|nr:hypothetical protein N7456_011056 [Penicillium angulare]
MSTPSYNQNDLMDIFYAGTAAYPELHTPQLSVSGYRANGLPEEQFAEYAIDGFFRCAATLFFVKTQQEARQLLYRVYHDSRIAIGDISELCALAAIGSHYDMNRVPQEARAIFFYRASTTLNGTIPLDSIQGVRIFICLCMNCIMDKSTTARTLIGMGFFPFGEFLPKSNIALVSTLGLARLQITKELRDVAVERGSESQYRRLLRTLIFLEGYGMNHSTVLEHIGQN